MPNVKTPQEYFKLSRLPAFGQLELLQASYSTHVFPRHWNETFVIQIVEQGVNEFYCRRATYQAPAGSLVLINPYEIHTGCSIGEAPLMYRTLYPTPELMVDLASQFVDHKSELPFFPKPVVVDTRLVRMLVNAHRAGETAPDQLAAQSLILVALAFLIRRHAAAHIKWPALGHEIAAIQRAKEYLNGNFAKNISLRDLAKISHLSCFHLLRAFRKEVGLPPHEYLISIRIERAKTLLAQGWSIAQAAYETGFVDQSHLHRQFKRIVGVTPGQYVR